MMDGHGLNGSQTGAAKPLFIDVFAGAGGLALGLLQAGWHGLFAIEKSPMAFETFKYNLIDQADAPRLDWPSWLPTAPLDIETCLETYKDRLDQLKGLPLLAGGPPCQGFSEAGRRKHDDERNRLFERYLDLVSIVEPRILLVENVRGFSATFTKTQRGTTGTEITEQPFNASDDLQRRLIEMGYKPFVQKALKAKDFGVPQLRPRYILIAIREDFLRRSPALDPFRDLYERRYRFLSSHGLPVTRDVTLAEAISDLEKRHGDEACAEQGKGMDKFRQGLYGPSEGAYQELMRRHRDGSAIGEGEMADSHRFPNHGQDIVARFRRIIDECRPGIQLSEAERLALGLNKHRVAPLARDQACHTLTSLPDDLVHYAEPRIPTVREYARIQSFPDWFEVKARYTSGDKVRRVHVPRYTQVANAVPPLLAKALGLTLLEIYTTLARAPEPPTEDVPEPRQLALSVV